jgi:hypothetical protein
MKTFVILSGILLVVAGLANAEIYEYELPDLTGPSTNGEQMTTLVYDGAAGTVNSLTLLIEGTVDVLGLIVCESVVPPDTSVWPLGPGSRLLKAGDTGYWYGGGEMLDALGPFADSWTHNTFNGGFPGLVAGDTIEVYLCFCPTVLVGLCSPITAPTAGTATSVTLAIDVAPIVPVEDSTWGRIKGLYD